MAEFDRLNGCIEWIGLSFVERRRTPDWAIQVGIRCHFAGMSLRYASNFLDELGVDRSHAAVHNWVHKADLQPASSVTTDQIAVDEKMIRINGQKYWLYGAVDPHSNEFLHVRLFSTTTK
jgi:transposase-like protein